MSTRIRIELTFDVIDPDALIELADEAIAENGMGVEVDESTPLAARAVEVLLHSNRDIAPYADYGLQLLDTNLVES